MNNINDQIFDNLDSIAKCYWLGFCYADSLNKESINTLYFRISKIKFDHLIKCALFFNIPKEKVKITKSQEYEFANLNIYSGHICKKLIEIGLTASKLNLKYPLLQNNLDFTRAFFRGYMDGKGNISCTETNKEWRISFTGIENIINEINNTFIKLLNCKGRFEKNTRIIFAGNERVKSILDWIYEDSNESVRFDLNYKKYLQLIEQQENKTR